MTEKFREFAQGYLSKNVTFEEAGRLIPMGTSRHCYALAKLVNELLDGFMTSHPEYHDKDTTDKLKRLMGKSRVYSIKALLIARRKGLQVTNLECLADAATREMDRMQVEPEATTSLAESQQAPGDRRSPTAALIDMPHDGNLDEAAGEDGHLDDAAGYSQSPIIAFNSFQQEDGYSNDAAGDNGSSAEGEKFGSAASASPQLRSKKRMRGRRGKRKLEVRAPTYVAIKVYSEESKNSVLDRLSHYSYKSCDVLWRPDQEWVIVVTFIDGKGPTTIHEVTSEIDKADWKCTCPGMKHVSSVTYSRIAIIMISLLRKVRMSEF
jgi:hypothetical protein